MVECPSGCCVTEWRRAGWTGGQNNSRCGVQVRDGVCATVIAAVAVGKCLE